MKETPMTDAFSRTIDYLRVSVTDRCNLRCRYCMPHDLAFTPHANILRYEEIERLCRIFTGMGVKHIRVTGGEPLARRDVMGLLRCLRTLPGIETLGLTSNGTLLGEHIEALREMPIDSLNISLDTLNREKYRALTGVDALDQVLSALHRALHMGINVKLNCVVLRGENEAEIPGIARLAESKPLEVRFIELMPMGAATAFQSVPGGKILARLREIYPDLMPIECKNPGPSKLYQSRSMMGKIGFINAITDHFCEDCNRIRLSSQGFLKLCLFHEAGLDLRAPLRSGATDAELRELILDAVAKKPEGHAFGREHPSLVSLSGIGG